MKEKIKSIIKEIKKMRENINYKKLLKQKEEANRELIREIGLLKSELDHDNAQLKIKRLQETNKHRTEQRNELRTQVKELKETIKNMKEEK